MNSTYRTQQNTQTTCQQQCLQQDGRSLLLLSSVSYPSRTSAAGRTTAPCLYLIGAGVSVSPRGCRQLVPRIEVKFCLSQRSLQLVDFLLVPSKPTQNLKGAPQKRQTRSDSGSNFAQVAPVATSDDVEKAHRLAFFRESKGQTTQFGGPQKSILGRKNPRESSLVQESHTAQKNPKARSKDTPSPRNLKRPLSTIGVTGFFSKYLGQPLPPPEKTKMLGPHLCVNVQQRVVANNPSSY